ncbi:hypothetical protein ACFZBM_17275 [Streptomyces lavendulae]|uniref:hypothetical protein n=1 Tax=Streptomyces lavendulae TaxID=1914 RepID=UPI0036DFA7FF
MDELELELELELDRDGDRDRDRVRDIAAGRGGTDLEVTPAPFALSVAAGGRGPLSSPRTTQ